MSIIEQAIERMAHLKRAGVDIRRTYLYKGGSV